MQLKQEELSHIDSYPWHVMLFSQSKFLSCAQEQQESPLNNIQIPE